MTEILEKPSLGTIEFLDNTFEEKDDEDIVHIYWLNGNNNGIAICGEKSNHSNCVGIAPVQVTDSHCVCGHPICDLCRILLFTPKKDNNAK